MSTLTCGDDGACAVPAATTITYVTDPLCSGCWALEPAWRRLRFREPAGVRYVYGGLLPSWDGFRDRANGIAAPEDVASHWEEVARRSGQAIDAGVWRVDPPESSFPASIAAVAVRLVAPEHEGAYLRRVRELVFLERANIARAEVLEGALATVDVDPASWRRVLDNGAARTVFGADLDFARTLGVHVLPTVVADGRVITEEVRLGRPAGAPPPLQEALSRYGRATTMELSVLTELVPAQVEAELRAIDTTFRDGQWRS